MTTIMDVLSRLATSRRPVIRASGRHDLDGAGLLTAAKIRDAVPAALNGRRVAVVGPDTAETAVALLSVAAVATAAPLNPDSTESEFTAAFHQLGVDVVLAHVEAPLAASQAATSAGTPVIHYAAVPKGPAGVFELMCGVSRKLPPPRRAREGVAFVLQTSGTTGHPKTVPLVDERIMITAQNIAQRLSLSERDCALSIMPLFHVHGILNVLLSSLSGGASVFYGGRFDPMRFFDWLGEADATWYSAVPAMHDAVLARARLEGRRLTGKLRFVRSSSASLLARTRGALEDFFGVPVIESYGMTEVDQIASQQLPPAMGKPGSVGVSGGTEIRIVTASGIDAAVGEIGEVCVRGPNVFPGYEDDTEANARAFVDGFFRTGDLGRIDEDRHLWLEGRIKEVINRGGEKISPLEIDLIMAAHPGVEEAGAFAVHHPTLGEEVALAVVPREPRPSAAELRVFGSHRLAPFKLPARVWFVEALPRGPTGKLLRHKLTRMFGRNQPPGEDTEPADPLEAQIARIWCDVLGLDSIRRGDRFSSLGGTSHTAAKIVREVEKHLGVSVPVAAIAKAETLAEFTEALRGST
jgi:acyl-CoA synthetase (AMP-forming)/AMP-acid ligase II